MGRLAQSVYRQATGWTAGGSNPGWGEIFRHMSRPALGPTQPTVQWVPGLFPGANCGHGVLPTPHPLLVPWSRKSRAILLLLLWAVRPAQSINACTRVHFFPLKSLAYFHSILLSQVSVGLLRLGMSGKGTAVAQWLRRCATGGDRGSTVVKVLCYWWGPR